MTPIRLLCATVLSITFSGQILANNIQVTNATITGNTGTTLQVQFDLSWENSWRGGPVTNWDAAWVFVKYRTNNGLWTHVNLNNSGHSPAPGSEVVLGLRTPGATYHPTTNPVVGVFVQRDSPGSGALNLTGMELQWNFSTLGLSFIDIAAMQVFAVEMVYVPEGPYYLGSGGTEEASFTDGSWASGPTIPFRVESEAEISFGEPVGQLSATNAPIMSIIPAGYPKGYRSYYCMKYELSQQQYVDFLNTLTYGQQAGRTAFAPNSTVGTGALVHPSILRSAIQIKVPGVNSHTPAEYACNLNGNAIYGEPNDGLELACHPLSWGDVAAYLDWSGLRPMTELEFEKACRGPLFPFPDEFPWGTTAINAFPYYLLNEGAANEGIGNFYANTGNAVYQTSDGSPSGPKRVGVFAGNALNTGRVSAGSGYYGAMELGGNVFERVINVLSPQALAFTGAHGDGSLSVDGEHGVMGWPSSSTAVGAGLRGGSFSYHVASMRVSSRGEAGNDSEGRLFGFGGRGVRTAP